MAAIDGPMIMATSLRRIHLSEEPLASTDLLRLTHDLRSEDSQQ